MVAALDNPVDLLMLLLIAFLIFGKQLPDVARSLGKSIRELKESGNFGDLTDALHSVNEVRSAVSPTNLARAALPGVAEFHDSIGVARDLATNPFGDAVLPDEPASDSTAATSLPAETPAAPASSVPAETPVASATPVPSETIAPAAEPSSESAGAPLDDSAPPVAATEPEAPLETSTSSK
jgi:TatA/E family protein of Tat protein translocase